MTGHYTPHLCPTCGLCQCGCHDCHPRSLTLYCACPDCDCLDVDHDHDRCGETT